MFAEIRYYCHKCNEHKLARIGNAGLPAESLRFQIEISGINCPSCGNKINNISPQDYIILEK